MPVFHSGRGQAPSGCEMDYFETTMMGEKRRGHLWEHTHGKAQPQAERR